MKKSLLIFFSILFTFSCDSKDKKLDLTKAENVLNEVFIAARTNNFSNLDKLCDPLGKGDNDTKMICSLAKEKNDKNIKEFIKAFKNAEIKGNTLYKNGYALVPFLFYNGKQEKMKLVKRNNKWYLFSF